jgi:hypothetical protein
MTTERDPRTRTVLSWLREDAHENPERMLLRALDEVDTTPQRRSWWPARRFSDMNNFAKVLFATAAVVAVAVVGINLLPRSGTGTGGPVPSPSHSPSPMPTSSPIASPAASPPPLTQTFTSEMHGMSVSYPEGWTARAATEPWTDRPGIAEFVDPGFDVLQDPVLTDHLFLYIASRPIGDSTPEKWVAALMADYGCTTTEPIAVDGATGLIGADDCDTAAVTTAGRGYWISLNASDDDPVVVAPYDRAWFEEVLATVQFQPEDAVDVVPSASR